MNAVNDFEKDFLKLMINSVYGKIMENFRKIIKVRLVNNAEDFKNTYIACKVFSENYAAIHQNNQF